MHNHQLLKFFLAFPTELNTSRVTNQVFLDECLCFSFVPYSGQFFYPSTHTALSSLL